MLHFNLARGYAQAEGARDAQALRHLDTADRIAPQGIRNVPVAREVLLDSTRLDSTRLDSTRLDSTRPRPRPRPPGAASGVGVDSLRNRFGVGTGNSRSVNN
ncbi:MAG: hypothetical protein M3460_03575 [Actinomycetota bacterium]|nr:hypothetical protein [Actinomycetota bacterium]